MKDFTKPKAVQRAKVRRVASGGGTFPLHIKSILVPIDFSPLSRQSLDYAVAYARKFQAKLTLLHVVEPVAMPDFAASFPLVLEEDKLMASAHKKLASVVKTARIPQALVEKILVHLGSAFNEIATAARACKVDLIIISTHGYSGVKFVLLGSTTERVVRHAPCPVLVLPQR